MPSPASETKTPCLCIRLRRAAQRMTDFYSRMLAPVKLTVNQFSLLNNLSRMEGCGTGELARKVGQDKSTLVRTLQPLLRDGLINDHSSEDDRRRQLFLTPQGRSILDRAIPLWQEAQAELVVKLGKKQAELMEFFDKLDSIE